MNQLVLPGSAAQQTTSPLRGYRPGYGIEGCRLSNMLVYRLYVPNDASAAAGGAAGCTTARGAARTRGNQQLDAPIQNLDVEVKGNRFEVEGNRLEVVFHLRSFSLAFGICRLFGNVCRNVSPGSAAQRTVSPLRGYRPGYEIKW